MVLSEDDQTRQLLETRISKDDGYQKQQDTLIVWTEQNGTDMALSFQEPEGCANIWYAYNQCDYHDQCADEEQGLCQRGAVAIAAVSSRCVPCLCALRQS